jgi:lysine-specific demethylase 3
MGDSFILLRQVLYEETGVKSYRIYQRPGDGVFIPAGCAHQVCFLFYFWCSSVDFVLINRLRTCLIA